MIVIKRRKGFLSYSIRWYDPEPNFELIPITVYYQVPVLLNNKYFKREEFWTLLSSLDKSDDELLLEQNSTNKTQIKQARKLDLQIRTGTFENFLPFFNDFSQDKGISGTTQSKLQSFGRDALEISEVVNSQGKVLAMHANLIDKNIFRSRLIHSASARFTEELDASLVGRANRLLHFENLIRYREMGLKYYDWGGIAKNSNDPVKVGINRFKEAFGGQEVCEYHYYPFYAAGKLN